ncbi:MAG: hypothetical protein JNJ90_12690, partial [Saprospiraceae bacterium]|nr:hypothetical protein [Saprospiraceae bacterium]
MKQVVIFLLIAAGVALRIEEGAGQGCNSDFTFVVSGCNVVSFTPDTVNPTFSYLWDFGDGNTSMQSNPVHIFKSYGAGTQNFTVKLQVSAPTCNTTSTTQVVQVKQVPDAKIGDASGNDFLDCSDNGKLTITNESSTKPTNVKYTIIWGDPNSAPPSSDTVMSTNFAGTLSHQYSIRAQYLVKIIVEGSNGCVNSDSVSFIWSAEPKATVGYLSNNPICVPDSALISISNFSNNTPNTQYFLRINDGSPGYLFNHPPPTTFLYPLDKSSCDTTSIINGVTYNHAFQVSVTAITGCPNLTLTNANGPIRTRSTPEADFTVDPFPVICQNDTVTIRNMSTSGLFWNSASNTCSNAMSVRWAIFPNTGYTITSGSLTDSVGFDATFQTPGNYTIRLIVENNINGDPNNSDPQCKADTLTKSICILPIPQSNFNKSAATGCAPLIDTLTNTSNTLGSCVPATYEWSVTFVGSDCGNMGDYQFINNTGPNSVNAQIRFNLPGKYYVRLKVTNQCGMSEKLDSVIIAGTPVSTITPIPDTCGSITIMPTIESSNYCNGVTPTYVWTYPPPHAGTFTGTNPPSRTYSTPGTYTITLTTQGCSNTQATETFQVFPLPPVPLISANIPCPGDSLIFTNLNAAGLTCAWTGPNGFTSTDCDPVISPAAPENAGQYCLTVTNSFGCTSSACITVSVLNRPPVVAQPAVDSICLGQSATFTATGATTYTWRLLPLAPPPQGPPLSSGPSLTVTPPSVGTYQYQVEGRSGQNCINWDTVTVVVLPLPVVSAGSPQTVCINESRQLNGTPSSGGTGFWTGPPNVVSGTGLANPNLNAPPGNHQVTYHFRDNNGCEDSSKVSICVLPLPAATFLINNNLGCDSLQVQTTNTSNAANCVSPTYAWGVTYDGAPCQSGNGVWNFTSGNASSQQPGFKFTKPGTYTIQLTVTNQCGTSTATRVVTVAERPRTAIDTIGNFCNNATISPTSRDLSCLSPITSHIWLFPGGMPASSTSATPQSIMYPVGCHTITHTVTNGCGSATDTEDFCVLQGPTINLSLDKDKICLGDMVQVTNTSTGDQLDYTWSVAPTGPTFAPNNKAAAPKITFGNGLAIGNYVLTVSVKNPVCAAITWTDTVNVSRPPALKLDSIINYCETAAFTPNAVYNLYGLAQPQDYIDSVRWTFVGACVPASQTSTDFFPPTAIQYCQPGTYTVCITAYNRCGSATACRTFQVL